MRHRVNFHSFGRRPGPRKALIRGLVDSLVENGRIKTTLAKAKELRRHVEKAITSGKKGDVHTRRILLQKYPNKNTVETIFSDLAKRFEDRPGGYTRIIKLGGRPGDQAEMAFIEFVDYQFDATKPETVGANAIDEAKKVKLNALAAQRARKSRRKMQTASRRENR